MLCAQPFAFSISADPGSCRAGVKSARLILGGPLRISKKEVVEPYMVFGDAMTDGTTYSPFNYQGYIYGDEMLPGAYSIKAKFFRRSNHKRLVDEIAVNFTVVDCSE